MPTYTGTSGDDQAAGGYDRMYGLAGHDTLTSTWQGQVSIEGGSGHDILGTHGWGRLDGGADNDWVGGGDTLNVDTILGGSGDDVVFGDTGRSGRGGADFIDGGDGRDALFGDDGSDTIYGGDGDDSGSAIAVGRLGFRYMPGFLGKEGEDYLDCVSSDDLLCGE